MTNIKKTVIFSMVTLMMIFSAACSKSGPEPTDNKTQEPSKEAKAVTLNVAAAASLKDSMEEIKTAYAKEKSDVTITYNFGASGTLQQQIEQGAETDIFISAAAKQMDALKDKKLIVDDTRKNLVGNRLVLVVPKDFSGVSDFKDLAGDKVKKIALGEPKSVPAGQYAEEVLKNLKILDTVKPNAVYAKDVKEVLAWVETGNVDAGVVYETDAKASGKVKIAAVASEDSHKPILYPAAVISGSKNQDAAKDFINYLYSEKSKAVFEKYGYTFVAK